MTEKHDDRVGLLSELASKIVDRGVITTALTNANVYRNCLTCTYFVEHMEMCERFNARPPARIIAYGCEKHSDEIPF